MAIKASKDLESRSELAYEKLRFKRIEDNRKRLEELGLLEHATLFKKNPAKATTPRRTVKKSTLNPEESAVEARRSPRVSRNPSINYNETKAAAVEERPRQRKGIGRVLKRGFVSPAARTEAVLKAGKVKTEHPSFVKAMLKSHVSGGFWLGLPSAFCDMHFSKDDLVILEDEDGLEWETIYLHQKRGLSGGWRGFSIDHDLEDGDALIFQLVKPTRFKVYVTRATDSKRHALDPKVATQKKSYRYALKENKENEHVNSALHKDLKREQLQTEGNMSRAKTVKPSRKRKLDLPEQSTREHGVQQQIDSATLVEVSDSVEPCDGDAKLTESSPPKSGQGIERSGGPATRPVRKSANPYSGRKGGSERSTKNKPLKATNIFQTGKDNAASAVDEEKGVVLTKKMRVMKKVVEQKINIKSVSKNTPNLSRGVKIKAVGVCSIARNCSSSKKLPGSKSKYSFFSPPKVCRARRH